MRSTPIGIAMLNDERPHVYEWNNPINEKVVASWAQIIRDGVKNVDGSAPDVVVASKIVTSVRTAQEVGEELSRQNVKQLILCYNVWNFPFLVWPLVNSIGRDIPILNLSNNNGAYPGNVGLLATDGALRQAGIRTHRIVGEQNDPDTQKKCSTGFAPHKRLRRCETRFWFYGGHSMEWRPGISSSQTEVDWLQRSSVDQFSSSKK